MDSTEPSLFKRILHFIDLRYMIVSVLVLVAWSGLALVPPIKLYFPKNDSNTLFPVKGSTVPYSAVLAVAFGLFNIAFIVLYFVQRRFPAFFKHFSLFTVAWSHLFVVSITGAVTNIFKSFVGRSRPDIVSRCSGYPDEVGCVNVTEKKYLDSYKSWPSGHSSTVVSSTAFMALFIISLPKRRNVIADAFACLLMLYSIYVSSSRINDFRHHTDDVLAGMFIGFLFAYVGWKGTEERIYKYKELDKEDNVLL